MSNIFLFFAIWILLWSPIAFLLGRKLQWDFPHPPTPEQKIPLVLSLYLLAPPLLWALIHRSGQTWADLGWVWTGAFPLHVFALRLGLGLAAAVGSLVVLWGVERSLGWIRFSVDGPGDGPALLKLSAPILAIALAISVVEELIFRGFLATQFATVLALSDFAVLQIPAQALFDGSPLTVAVLLVFAATNLLFALLHLPWDRWQVVVPQLPGLWLMGMVLSLAAWQWGDLAVAIGLHGGWVWAIASLDSIEGITDSGTVPDWVTGVGGYLLAGVMGVVFLGAIGTGIVLLPS